MSIGGDEYGERDRTGQDDPTYGRGSGRLTTRTRLPEGEGGTRPTPRPGRSLVTVVGVVVVLIAAIAFANQGGGGDTDEAGSAGDKGGGPAEAQPTAPSGEKPVKYKEGATPSGFSRTKQGAESAAANYSVALGGDKMYSAVARQKIVSAVYTKSSAAKREDSLNDIYSDTKFLKSIGLKDDGTAPKGQTFISRTSPVGTKLLDFSKTDAKVSVWFSSLFGIAGEGSKNPVSESWYTSTFQLKWSDGDWKVVDFKQKDGPAPISKDQKSAPADEMTDAVNGFGGFTYAR